MRLKKTAFIRSSLMLTLGLGLIAGCETTDRNAPAKDVSKAAAGDECACCAVPTTAPATRPTANVTTQPTARAAGESTVAATTKPSESAGWKNLFDGKSLKNWKVADYAGHGEVVVEDGLLVLPAGEGLTGVTWTGEELPKTNYELEVIAKKMDGVDFFCGMTFPVNDSFASFINGGWGGAVVGISSIDGEDAANNETTVYEKFEVDRFYKLRVRVEPKTITAWIDDKEVVNVDIEGKKVSIRGDIDQSKPLGLASWTTTGAVKSVKIRELPKK